MISRCCIAKASSAGTLAIKNVAKLPTCVSSLKTPDDVPNSIVKLIRILFRAGQSVLPFEDWLATIPGDHPGMREMVQHAAKTGSRSGNQLY